MYVNFWLFKGLLILNEVLEPGPVFGSGLILVALLILAYTTLFDKKKTSESETLLVFDEK